jgi:hypothetical protein
VGGLRSNLRVVWLTGGFVHPNAGNYVTDNGAVVSILCFNEARRAGILARHRGITLRLYCMRRSWQIAKGGVHERSVNTGPIALVEPVDIHRVATIVAQPHVDVAQNLA